MTPFEQGVVLGLLIGEGHFGGDAKQPQITVRMHVRHYPMLRWMQALLPGGALYGPYEYSGRRSYQLMFRHAYLREVVVPLLHSLPWAELDPHSYGRFRRMLARYRMWDGLRPECSPGNMALLSPPPRYASLAELLAAVRDRRGPER